MVYCYYFCNVALIAFRNDVIVVTVFFFVVKKCISVSHPLECQHCKYLQRGLSYKYKYIALAAPLVILYKLDGVKIREMKGE